METKQQIKLLRNQEIEDSPEIQEIYFNGFMLAIGAGDVTVTLVRGAKKVIQLNASYTVAKTLSEQLARLLEVLEKQTSNRIMTTDEVHAALSKDFVDEEPE